MLRAVVFSNPIPGPPWLLYPSEQLPGSPHKVIFLGAAWSKGNQVCRGWQGWKQPVCISLACTQPPGRCLPTSQALLMQECSQSDKFTLKRQDTVGLLIIGTIAKD